MSFKKLDIACLTNFINIHVGIFHDSRVERLKAVKPNNLLKRKNPYLFRTKNILKGSELVAGILEAFLSSSEEELFGKFLEEVAIYVSEQTLGGKKSSSTGIDLELERDKIRYLVSIKSGPNWGNKSQYDSLKRNFRTATSVLKQSKRGIHVQPVLGICYGKTKTKDNGEYMKVTGQNFWYFLSNDRDLYTKLIEPLGHEAKKHNDRYEKEKARVFNEFTKVFIEEFCLSGEINWNKLIEFNSGNLDLELK